MRPRHSLPVALLFLLSTFLLLSSPARAADDEVNGGDEYDEHARVLRISLLKGEVSLRRAGNVEWERAQLNTPLVEGDTLATGRDSRLEIQADSRNFVRVGPDSVLTVSTLRDEGIALSITEGTATIRLARFDKDKEYFEVDAPKTTVAAEKTGQYRIDVDAGGVVRVTVREDGRARVYSQSSGFELRNNRSARFAYDNTNEGDWELSAAAEFDEWDYWNDERERYLASRLKYEGRERYYDSEVYGAEELDLYGDWVYTRDYGYVWRPHVTVINNYYDWAPYRYGHWDWCPPYGWTWIPDEDWGWAPYHYGRWVYVNNYWCWAPRGYGYPYHHAWWRPALVVFVSLDFGHDRHVCWYPLSYGQRDPRGRWWSRRYDPLTPLRSGQVDNLRRANPALLRAVTSVPARDFGAGNLRARPASVDLAQRAISSEPLRGQLPVARSDAPRAASPRAAGEGRANAPGSRTTGANGRDVLTINNPAAAAPPRAIPNRTTGATARTPGVPLDGELRRTRIFNNREPRVAPPATTASDGSSQSGDGGARGVEGGARGVDEGTGAVTRPGRTSRPRVDSGGEDKRTPRVQSSTPAVERPADSDSGRDVPRGRRERPEGGTGDSETTRTRPTRTPVEHPSSEQPSGERPSGDSPRVERPSPASRPEPRVRPSDEGERSAPTRREEPPPARREEPRQERPEPRSEPRHEQPRNDPPTRSEPRQEAPRQEAPRQERSSPPPRESEQRAAPPPKSESRPARDKPDDQ